jgi:hypothetical protein
MAPAPSGAGAALPRPLARPASLNRGKTAGKRTSCGCPVSQPWRRRRKRKIQVMTAAMTAAATDAPGRLLICCAMLCCRRLRLKTACLTTPLGPFWRRGRLEAPCVHHGRAAPLEHRTEVGAGPKVTPEAETAQLDTAAAGTARQRRLRRMRPLRGRPTRR